MGEHLIPVSCDNICDVKTCRYIDRNHLCIPEKIASKMHLRVRFSNAFLHLVTFTWPMLSNVWVQCVLFSQLKCKIVLKNLTCKWIFNFWKINKKLWKCAFRENAIIFLSIKFTHYSSRAVLATFYFLCNIRIGPMSYIAIFGRLF